MHNHSIEYAYIIQIMKIEKENSDPNYSSFSGLLKKIDLSRLNDFEITTLKQEHSYLEKLRHQRLKIEELKRKYQDSENSLRAQFQENERLVDIINEKSSIIEELEEKLDEQIMRMESLQKNWSKESQKDKHKTKARVRQLEQENEDLKKILKQKEVLQITFEQEYNDKLKHMKEAFSMEKKSIINDCEQRINKMKSKLVQGDILELKNLVTRQSKALRLQNQKYEEVCAKNDAMVEDMEWYESQLDKKNIQIDENRARIEQLGEELKDMYEQLQEQSQDNRIKGQLDEIRKKMNEMTKGEIQKIQFIVNEQY